MVPMVLMGPNGSHASYGSCGFSDITALDMCEVCTEAVHSVALSQHELHHSFGHV